MGGRNEEHPVRGGIYLYERTQSQSRAKDTLRTRKLQSLKDIVMGCVAVATVTAERENVRSVRLEGLGCYSLASREKSNAPSIFKLQ